MAKLPSELFGAIVDFMVSTETMKDKDTRKELLIPLLGDRAVIHKIDWEGAAKMFTVRIVDLLAYENLIEVLESLRTTVGEERKPHITLLCERVTQEMRERTGKVAALASIKGGINVIEGEVDAKNQAVRDEVCLLKEKLEDTSHQIGEMRLFKIVHDSLHTIEHECLLPMKDKNATIKPRYQREFDKQSHRIEEAIKEFATNPLLEDLIKDLIDLKNRAAEDFQTIEKMPNNAAVSEMSVAFDNLVNSLDNLLSGLPAQFNTNIREAARKLNLDRLVELLTKVKGALSRTEPGQELKLELLSHGINNLKRFQEEFIMQVKEHNQLQILDGKLRTVCVGKTIQRKEDLKAEWKRIKEMRFKLKAPFTTELAEVNEVLVEIERDIDEAIERTEENNAKDQLNEYFREVGKVFRDVDSSLKSFCEKLNQVSEPLKTVLSKC
jgi:hypothetical protein